MKYSKLFGKTSKTVTKEATAASHKLLLQAGFIRQLSAGRYTLLPLGFKVAKKIEQIIRLEVEKTGAQEVSIPTLHPIELWQRANRDKKFGSAMMRVKDRNDSEFTLSATGEVVMLDLVDQFKPTYKDLPINIYQFTQKFRDEARATGGLLRVREFVMKDGYSFHQDEADLMITFNQYKQAYCNIFKKIELNTIPVEADSGAIGGNLSYEFMTETDVGEDTIAKCDCGYVANLEKATFVKHVMNPKEVVAPLKEVEAIRGATMEDGVKLHGLPLWQQTKDVMFVDETGRFILALIRGDFNVNETKLKNLINATELRHATNDEIINTLHSYPGFISPVGFRENIDPSTNFILVADDSMRPVINMYGGSNKQNIDLLNINIDRDWTADIEGDIAAVETGFLCPKCQKSELKLVRAIENGHIFNIGYVYSEPTNTTFVNQDGSLKNIYMGSYGIGIGRALATVVEIHHDDKGIIWPESIAPYQVHLIGLDLSGEKVESQAIGLYEALQKNSIEVLFDDRPDVSAGAKFADADLIGIPTRLVVSKRSLEKGGIEFKKRNQSEASIKTLEDILILFPKT